MKAQKGQSQVPARQQSKQNLGNHTPDAAGITSFPKFWNGYKTQEGPVSQWGKPKACSISLWFSSLLWCCLRVRGELKALMLNGGGFPGQKGGLFIRYPTPHGRFDTGPPAPGSGGCSRVGLLWWSPISEGAGGLGGTHGEPTSEGRRHFELTGTPPGRAKVPAVEKSHHSPSHGYVVPGEGTSKAAHLGL